MSRTHGHDSNAKAGLRGKEFWKSRLHRGGEALGRVTKKLTAKFERRMSRKIAREEQ